MSLSPFPPAAGAGVGRARGGGGPGAGPARAHAAAHESAAGTHTLHTSPASFLSVVLYRSPIDLM